MSLIFVASFLQGKAAKADEKVAGMSRMRSWREEKAILRRAYLLVAYKAATRRLTYPRIYIFDAYVRNTASDRW